MINRNVEAIKMGYFPVEIFDDDLESIRGILEGWVECIEKYIDVWDGDDLPYWYNERANVSILCGAAWRADVTAIEEYQSKKNDKGEDRNGRNDLYLADGKEIYIGIEAKVCYPDIHKNETMKIDDALGAAIRDASKLKEQGRKVAAVFIVPFSKDVKASKEQVDDFLSRQISSKYHAWAWAIPKKAQKWKSHDNKYYPLVGLVLLKAD